MVQRGLFRKSATRDIRQDDNEIVEIIRRSRILEGRYANLERRAQVIEREHDKT